MKNILLILLTTTLLIGCKKDDSNFANDIIGVWQRVSGDNNTYTKFSSTRYWTNTSGSDFTGLGLPYSINGDVLALESITFTIIEMSDCCMTWELGNYFSEYKRL